MFSKPVAKNDLAVVKKFITEATSIVITCHVKPDGDAVGSTLALWHVLSLLGKHAYVVTPDSIPEYLRFLPGAKEIIPYSSNQDFAKELLEKASLIFCLDFNSAYRVDRMQIPLLESPAHKIMIDHHLGPEDFVAVTISHPEDSSTCYLLFKVLCQLGLRPLVNKDAAACLAAGMMTDTGNFSYSANDPDTYRVMAELLTTGIDKVSIWEKLNIKSEWQLRLSGFALSKKMELFHSHHSSLICMNREDLDEYHFKKGDLEGVVNIPLQIPEVKMSVLMHQEPQYIKVSMRSKGNVPVNKVCELFFDGGGHQNAAGGEFKGTIEEARQKLIEAFKEFSDCLA